MYTAELPFIWIFFYEKQSNKQINKQREATLETHCKLVYFGLLLLFDYHTYNTRFCYPLSVCLDKG